MHVSVLLFSKQTLHSVLLSVGFSKISKRTWMLPLV